MRKQEQSSAESPHIVRELHGVDGALLGAIADNEIVNSPEQTERILREIGDLYGETLRRQSEALQLAERIPHG